jgi:hypothetical protein
LKAGWSRITRAEAAAIAVTLVAALVARLWDLDSAGINHYDEGVYAISANGLADAADRHLFPNQIRFSPPFFFTATSILFQLLRIEPDTAGIVLNALLGTLTVAIIWAAGRAWFGPAAGIAAAVLLAGNQFHIMMSRVVLTDAAFACFFLPAIFVLVTALERNSLLLGVLGGVLTGLAWNTKYHGWFPLVITLAALLPALWIRRRDGERDAPQRLLQSFMVWAAAAIMAVLLYAPWAAYMRMYSGPAVFRNVVEYYMTLMSVDWPGGIAQHAALQAFLDGPATRASVLLAAAAVLLWNGRQYTSARWLTITAALGIGMLLIGGAGALLVLAALTVPALLRTFSSLRARALLAWLGLWIVAAPFYHAYARLILPLTVLLCLLAGWQLNRLLRAADPVHGHARSPWTVPLALVAAMMVAIVPPLLPGGGNPWRNARGSALAAQRVAGHVTGNERIYVVGEPQIAFYLRRAGRTAEPISEGIEVLDTVSAASLLVTGVYTQRAPSLRNAVEKMRPRLTPIDTIPYVPNDLRLLDDFRPRRARQYLAAPDSTFDLKVYRLAPAAR